MPKASTMVKLQIHMELETQVKKKDEDGGGGQRPPSQCEPEIELLVYWAQLLPRYWTVKVNIF
jgi:hypothetical protein